MADEELTGKETLGAEVPLREGETYSWDELGTIFNFPPAYLGLAGGMVSRPEMNSLLLITHPQAGKAFSYGDKWEDKVGGDLIYAGRGLTGDQELKGQNLQVAENSRSLFLFEHAGRHKLLFHSQVRCVHYWESTGFGKDGKNRRVYRFRLRSVNGDSRQRRRPRSQRTTEQRDPKSFRPRPFDPARTPGERKRAAPGDPESQKVASEQADKAHQRTLRDLGIWLKERSWCQLEEIDGAIDLMARSPGSKSSRVLFEIKGISPTTERARVRSGLAQLLEYRLFLGLPKDRLCLVSDHPISERRLRLLDSLSIGHVYIENGEVHISGTRASRSLFPDAS